MSNEYLELLGNEIRYKKEYVGNDIYRLYIKKNEIELLEKYLTELQAIKNAKFSEALDKFDYIGNDIKFAFDDDYVSYDYTDDVEYIKNTLIKAQEQEKENELLKKIIKSLFDRGCPLHQYIDKDWGLTIEVDNECSIMYLGKYKDIDLDEKLKEVLEDE